VIMNYTTVQVCYKVQKEAAEIIRDSRQSWVDRSLGLRAAKRERIRLDSTRNMPRIGRKSQLPSETIK
jgi:hypothetical protein